MKIILIAAIGLKNELGQNGDLIWKLKDDLFRFSVLTRDHIVIMGRKTYESLPGPLKRREMVVLSSKKIEEVICFKNVIDAMEFAESRIADQVYVIGGAQIYKEFLQYADELNLTIINKEYDKADTYFPEFEDKFYQASSVNMTDEYTKIDYKFTMWVKKYI